MSEAQYIDKVDSVAYMVNVLGQTARVRDFLSQTARSERGLPRRPIVGTAVRDIYWEAAVAACYLASSLVASLQIEGIELNMLKCAGIQLLRRLWRCLIFLILFFVSPLSIPSVNPHVLCACLFPCRSQSSLT